jgi:hypothetical protein
MKGKMLVFNLTINIVVNFCISFSIACLDIILLSQPAYSQAFAGAMAQGVNMMDASVAASSAATAPYTLGAFLAPAICGTIVGTIVLMLIPINQLTDKFAMTFGAKPGTPLFIPIKLLLFVLFMVIIMSLGVHAILYALGFNPMYPAGYLVTLGDWINPIPAYYPVAYIAAITSLPLGMAVAAKVSGFDPRKQPPSPE